MACAACRAASAAALGRTVLNCRAPGEETYSYDALGRTTQVAKKIYNVTYTTGYTYNLAGGVVNSTYPSGRVVKHEYDNIGRLKNVKNNSTGASYVSNAAYSTANQLTGYTYGNNVVASYGYSANRLQLTSVSYGSHLSLTYSYSQSGNNNGQIVSVTDNQQSGRTVAYTYDSLHRLKTALTNGSAGYPQWGLSWSYDRYGNRTAQSVTHGSGPSSSPTISTTNNRITALGGYTYSYDANGSLTQDDLFKYTYDAENRMVEIRNLSNTLLASYAYDGNGMQVIKVVGATRTWFIYAGAQLVSEYYDAASATYGAGATPGAAPGDGVSTLLYQHADHLTTRVTTDNNGDLSNQQAHYPYGENWYATGTADPSVKRKFTSYRKETDYNLASGQINYAIARYHGARTGRFQMADPLHGNRSNPQRLNRYAYVMGNPTNLRDPRGLDVEQDCDPFNFSIVQGCPKNFPLMEGGGDSPVFFGGSQLGGWIVYPPGGSSGGTFGGIGNGGFGWPGGGFGLPTGNRSGGSCICGCSCWDVLCVISGILFGCKETGCKVTLSDRSGRPACDNNEVFIKAFECTGEYECCRAEKRKFGDWCMDLPKNERKDLEYATARYWNWSPDTLHCCGGLKAKK